MLLRRRRRLSAAELEKRYNLNQIQKFEAVLTRHGRSLRQFSSILDFGCDHGRLTQYLFSLAPHARVFGCDILGDAVAECRRRFPQGRFVKNDPEPPLSFDDAQFDLIFSYSVFTHLTEANHASWLKEFGRTLRPGGVMLHTTHSYEFVRRAATFSPEWLEVCNVPGDVDAFVRSPHRYHYVVDNPATPEYGQTIISKEYVMTRWPHYSGLTLIDYAEGAIEAYPAGCQDIVMLAKEAP
jgi:SAM-dependent methyltransferase